MRLIIQLLLLNLCFSLSAQSEPQVLFFDKCGDLTGEEKYKTKRILTHNDSLIFFTDYYKNGKRMTTAEFNYSADLINSLEQYYSNYNDREDLKGIRKWYFGRDSSMKTEVLAPFDFNHDYSHNLEANCSTVDSVLHSQSTYTIEFRKDGTRYREGLYVNGDSFDGQAHGVWTYYTKKNEVSMTLEYVFDQIHGTQTFFQNGYKTSTRQFERGKKIGKSTFYDQNGNPF